MPSIQLNRKLLDRSKPRPRRWLLGIRGKMIAIIVGPTLLIYVVVLGVMFSRLIPAIEGDVQEQMTARAVHSAARFDAAFEQAAAIARTTASVMEAAPDLNEAQIFELLRDNVLQNEVVYGAAMAFEPGTFRSDDSLFCPYVYRRGDGTESMNITRDVYDWYADPQWTWWRIPKESNGPAWSDPYFDAGAGNALMVTWSVPFHRDGQFRGVTTVDIQVSKIRERVGAEILGDTEFIILTSQGDFVYTAREQDIMSSKTIFDAAAEIGRDDIAQACRVALSGSSGIANLDGSDDPAPGWERWSEESWLFYAPVKSTGWTLAAVVPRSIALGPARERIIEAAIGLAMTLVLIIACIVFVSSFITRPVSRLAAAVQRMATGDLDHRLKETSRDELGQLAHDVNSMAGDLKNYTEQLARARSRSREAMIFAMARLAESRDDDTGKHLERICCYCEILATAVANEIPGMDEAWVRTIAVTAALHDIGKVGIPDAVLKKPGKLTAEERAQMQSHTTIGGDMLIDVRRQWSGDDFLRTAAEIALSHHEHWNGGGYPFGLAGEDISLAARIVAVADVYDAITSKRVYKPAMPHEEAVRLIIEGAGRQFDPVVIAAFRKVEHQFRAVAQATTPEDRLPAMFQNSASTIG